MKPSLLQSYVKYCDFCKGTVWGVGHISTNAPFMCIFDKLWVEVIVKNHTNNCCEHPTLRHETHAQKDWGEGDIVRPANALIVRF